VSVRRLSLLLLALSAGGCERWEGPQGGRDVLNVDALEVRAPGGERFSFIRSRSPQDDDSQPVVRQGGRLINQDGCLLLYTGETEPPRVVVWPREAALDLSALGVIRVADQGRAVRVGQLMSVTGLSGGNAVAGPCAEHPPYAIAGFEPLTEEAWRAVHNGAAPPTPPMRVPPSPPPPADYLARGLWRVTRIAGTAPLDPDAVVGFRPNGFITAYAGCNRFEASLRVRRGRLERVDPTRGPLSTMANCTSAYQAQEDALFSILRPGSHVIADGEGLVIRDALDREVRLEPGGREPGANG